MLDYMRKRPMLLCAVIGSIMCILGFYSGIAAFFCGLLLIALFFIMLYKRLKPKYLIVTLMLFAMTVSVLITRSRIDYASAAASSVTDGDFIVIEDSENHGKYYSVLLEANGCDGLRNGTRILAFHTCAAFETGNRIKAAITLNVIDEKYRAVDYADGIYLTGNISNAKITDIKGDTVLHLTGRVRSYISDTLFNNIGYKEAATLNAIVSGDRSYLSDEFYGNIGGAGVSHVMVVSGMHLSVIVMLATALCERLFYNRRLKAVIIFLTVIFMTALCGFTKSILRAGACYIIYALSLITDRDNTPENTLGGAAALIFIVSPFTVLSISFQLSALSTLGIVACSAPCMHFIEEKEIIKSRALRYILSAVSVTVFALVFTLPVTINTFGYASTVSLVTNLLISQAVTLALSASAAALLLNLFLPFFAKPLFAFAELVTKYIDFIIDSFGSLPFSTVNLGKASFAVSIALLAAIVFTLFYFKNRSERLKSREINRKILGEILRKPKWR